MELRNYANECDMRIRRNDLRKDIENGYISHEQANQYLAEYAYELKYPDKKPDKTVIQFITDAISTYQCLILKKDFWISYIFLGKYLTHRKNISIMP